MKNRIRADESGAGCGGQNTVGRYVVKRHGKDREKSAKPIIPYFFLILTGLFPVFDTLIYGFSVRNLTPRFKKNALFCKKLRKIFWF